uniref:Uncharacterized protein n=1 Tax=Aegilops tauschii subsp. strangulata TaxID=200361 RepID=A0A453NLG5_AEGTS
SAPSSPRFVHPPLLLLHDALSIEPGCVQSLSWCSLFSAVERMGRQSTRVPTPPPPPPAREPHQVTTTEQAAAVPHFRAASSSTQAPPMDKQAWNAAAAASEFFSPTLHWGVDPRPPGGFVSYLGNPSSYPLPQQPPNQQAMLQHLHYSGGPSHYVPCPAPQPSPSLRKSRTPVTPSGSQQTINVDGEEDGDKRTEKRLAWTSQEDVRLVRFLCTHI